MAPECLMTGKANKETDVYTFGIIALEICCGRSPVEPTAKEKQIRLVEWVWDLYGLGKLFDDADLRLSNDFDEEQMERLMIFGLWCAHPDCDLRPSIRQAINVLNLEASLPRLPLKMSVPMYYSPLVLQTISGGATISESSHTQFSDFSNSITSSSKLFESPSSTSTPSVSLLHCHVK